MEGRHEESAATDRGYLRAAHADRDRVVASLQAAFVQGRLNKDELDARVGQALASRTYAELAALTADLPAAPAGVAAGPVAGVGSGTAAAEPAQAPARTMAKAASRSVIFLLLTIALVEGAFLTGSALFLLVAIYTFMAFTGFLGYGVVDAVNQRRARRQLPPAGQGGPAPQGIGPMPGPA